MRHARFLDLRVIDSDLSVRTKNGVIKSGAVLMRDVLGKSFEDLLNVRGFGRMCCLDLKREFQLHGFKFKTQRMAEWDPLPGQDSDELDRVVPGESRPVVTRTEAFPVAPPQPEFLPVSATVWARVDCVDFVEMFVNAPGMRVNARNGRFDVDAEYVAAWLDRLGIPWTDDLRKAHEAATKKGGEA